MDSDRPNNLILQGLGGPKLITQGLGPDLAYNLGFSYDSRGNLTCVADPDNGLTYYTYDKLSRMTSVTNPWGEMAHYEYSPGGKLLARTLGNGCVTYYAYDRRGVTKVENLKSDLSVISTFEYTRDRTGNPLSILREDGSCVYYEYDLNQQLTKETQTDDLGAAVYAWEWDYDRAGNRLWQTFNGEATYYTYNAGNELLTETTDGVTTYYEYDRNGNQTAKDGPDGTTVFHYDFENLLRQIDLPDGAHNYFTYDADSKRKSVADSSGYTRFIYQGPDMLKLLQERDGAGETKAQYTMGMGLESMRRGAASSFYHYDWLGSTQELTDGAGAVTDAYRYNAWGETLARTGTTENPHTYLGRERYYNGRDVPLGQLGLRYYAMTTGAFMSQDPLAFLGGTYPEMPAGVGFPESRPLADGYTYALNNPTSLADPSGYFAWIIVIVGGAAIVGAGGYWYWHERSHIRPFTPAQHAQVSSALQRISDCGLGEMLFGHATVVGTEDLPGDTAAETRPGFRGDLIVLDPGLLDGSLGTDAESTLIHEGLHALCGPNRTANPQSEAAIYSWAIELQAYCHGQKSSACGLPDDVCERIDQGKAPGERPARPPSPPPWRPPAVPGNPPNRYPVQ